jgi:hypothetical protein
MIAAPPPNPLLQDPLDFSYSIWAQQIRDPLQRVGNGDTPALTLSGPGGQFMMYVIGPSFGALTPGQQLTVMIHEFRHRNGEAGIDLDLTASDRQTVSACGTDPIPH